MVYALRMDIDESLRIARGWHPAPGLSGGRYRPAILALADEVERLRAIEKQLLDAVACADIYAEFGVGDLLHFLGKVS